jgi:adenine-specific DNA-methyltransferase
MSLDKITKGDELTQSLDIVNDNIARLKELFPEVLTEGKIDFKVLQDILGKEIEDEEEYYRFTWAGKAQARREAHKPSTGTLRPAKDESVNWDTTENLYIEGDNLEVLKLLQKSYNNKVKMIYIDPPYNTGKDFVYKDNYKDNLKNYQEITGQVDDEGNKLTTNSDTDGRYHSNWLNMMYPRLSLARNLLKDDGVIFMSIDDNEVENLKKLGHEIFGETNYEGHIHWRRRHNQPNDKTKLIGLVAEHILVYAKNSEKLKVNGVGKLPLTGTFSNPDNDIRGDWASKPWKVGSDQNGSKYTIKTPTGIIYDEEWMGEENTFKKLVDDGRIVFSDNGNGFPRKKYFKFEREEEGQCATNWWSHEIFGHNQEGNTEMTELFDGRKNLFSNPKNTRLLNSIIQLGNVKNNEIVLDFFSGSASIAHAIFKSNIDETNNKKFILVQLPEDLNKTMKIVDSKSKKNIENLIEFLDDINKPHLLTELGKERIRRTGKKIAEENPEKAKDLDLGFKVFKLDSSNIKGWDGNPDNLKDNLFDSQDNIKEGRKEEDVLFEILLKYGLDLTLPIEEKIIEGKKVFSVGFGALFICLADGITSKVAEGIGAWKEALNPEVCRVIFKDSGFGDVEKTNSVQTLKRFGINEIKSI